LIFKWYFDWLYNKFINIPFLKLSFKLFEVNDKKILEWCGPFIVNFIFYKISVNLKKLQTGWVQHYLYLMLISFFFLIFEIFNHPKLT
jgi:NADH:ubiquinone oxidoreductase subunit 5 (subunit L)/multisubunit Na+/H+ antiporter MnhA subunit